MNRFGIKSHYRVNFKKIEILHYTKKNSQHRRNQERLDYKTRIFSSPINFINNSVNQVIFNKLKKLEKITKVKLVTDSDITEDNGGYRRNKKSTKKIIYK